MFKKLISVCLVLALTVSVLGISVIRSGAAAADGWKYQTVSTDAVSITEYTGTDKVVVIPKELDGRRVISLGSQIFRSGGKDTVKEVFVPAGVTSISDTFSGCKNLVSVHLPDSLVWIGANAFNGCESLTELTIPDGVEKIGEDAFQHCFALKSVVIPDSVTSIGNRAFQSCVSLTDVSIPDSVTELGYAVFARCCSLRRAAIPEGIRIIPSRLYQGCRSLTSVTMGRQVTLIDKQAFYDCVSLKEIYIPSSVEEIADRALGWCNAFDEDCGGILEQSTGLVIKGASGCCAEKYAQDAGLTFVEADENVILYPETPLSDPLFGMQYLRVSDSKSGIYDIRWNEEFTLVYYAVSPVPIGSVKGQISWDTIDTVEILDTEICCSSEEEGALMTGEITANESFEVYATVADASRFDAYLMNDSQENGTTVTAYFQPLIAVRMKLRLLESEMTTAIFSVTEARDINGRLIVNDDNGFRSSSVEFGITPVGEGVVRPAYPAETDDPAPPAGIRGDADTDGMVTILDATRIRRFCAGMVGEDGLDKTAADADLDGAVTIMDATRIQCVLADLCDIDGSYPEDEPDEPAVDPDLLPTPAITGIESSNSGIVITWSPVEGAEGYRVFTKDGGTWQKLGDTTDATFTHADAAYDTAYTYTVCCISKEGTRNTSGYDPEGCRIIRLRAPVLKSAVPMDGFIGVSWDAVPGAEAYRVYIKGGQYRSWEWIYDTDINYIDVDTSLLELQNNTEYTFTVRCVDEFFGSSCTSGYDSKGVSVKYYDTPFIYGIVNTKDGVELYWTEVEGAAEYRVFEWNGDSWKKLTDTSEAALLVTGLSQSSLYRFTVRGLDSSGNYITPYDYYGRAMKWYPRNTAPDTDYNVRHTVLNIHLHAEELGYHIDDSASTDTSGAYVYLLDSTRFYYDCSGSTDALIYNRSNALLDYYTAMLRRGGAEPEEYSCRILTESDENECIWFYLALTPLK